MINQELLRRHASYLAEAWLPPGWKKSGKNYGSSTSLPGEIKKPSSNVTIVKQHISHSSKGKVFNVKQHERKIRGNGTISDPLVLDNDLGFKHMYQVKRKGANIPSKISPDTIYVRAKDKGEANKLADEYLANRK